MFTTFGGEAVSARLYEDAEFKKVPNLSRFRPKMKKDDIFLVPFHGLMKKCLWLRSSPEGHAYSYRVRIGETKLSKLYSGEGIQMKMAFR